MQQETDTGTRNGKPKVCSVQIIELWQENTFLIYHGQSDRGYTQTGTLRNFENKHCPDVTEQSFGVLHSGLLPLSHSPLESAQVGANSC